MPLSCLIFQKAFFQQAYVSTKTVLHYILRALTYVDIFFFVSWHIQQNQTTCQEKKEYVYVIKTSTQTQILITPKMKSGIYSNYLSESRWWLSVMLSFSNQHLRCYTVVNFHPLSERILYLYFLINVTLIFNSSIYKYFHCVQIRVITSPLLPSTANICICPQRAWNQRNRIFSDLFFTSCISLHIWLCSF